MKWDAGAVLAALTNVLRSDPVLTGPEYLEAAAYIVPRASERAEQIPSLAYTVIDDFPLENTHTMRAQLEVRVAADLEKILRITGRLTTLLHHTNVTTLDGLAMFARIDGTREITDKPGVYNYATDVLLEPAKLVAA